MEHSGVNPRSQVDFTEQSSVTSTCDGLGSSGYQQLSLKNMTTKLFELFIGG